MLLYDVIIYRIILQNLYYYCLLLYCVLLLYCIMYRHEIAAQWENGREPTCIIHQITTHVLVDSTSSLVLMHYANVLASSTWASWSYDLRCHIIYGVMDVAIILAWVSVTTRRRKRLECTIARHSINFAWSAISAIITLRSKPILL